MKGFETISSIAFAFCGCCMVSIAFAEGPKPCSEFSELDCIHSTECKLEQAGERGKYACRAATGHCELGFRQAGDGDIRKVCEAIPGCQFEPGSCYCPPNVACFCGGGPPAQCTERPKSHPRGKGAAAVAVAPSK